MIARTKENGVYGKKWKIKVFEAWKTYKNFRKWALENGYSADLVLDRINTYGDYSPQNCRFISRKHNSWNKRKYKNNKSGFKGVSFCKEKNLWDTRIFVNGKTHFIGRFTNKLIAAKLYDDAARKYFGEFATLNFG